MQKARKGQIVGNFFFFKKINVTNIETVFISAPNNDLVLAGSLAFVLLLRLHAVCPSVCTTGQC